MYAATHMVTRTGLPVLAVETRLLFLLTFAVCVVIPHSMQAPTAGLIVLTFIASLFVMRSGGRITYIGACYMAGAVVTTLYLAIGMTKGAPQEAVFQTVAIYIVSPLMWIVILRTALQLVTIEQLTRYMVVLAWLACASVALFYYMYMTMGRDSVTFFIEEANIYVGRGFAGATMHVYGSLIFLSGAFFAAPEIVKNKLVRVALLAALAAAALTSGRAALILAIPAGLAIGMVVRQLATDETVGGARRGMWVRYFLFILSVGALVMILDRLVPAVDLGVILQAFWDKLIEGGGEARTDQNAALWQGISDTYGLGAGHGIGASVTRNALYPWRYENVLLAVIFKTGFFGALIYASAFLIYFGLVVQRIVAGTLTRFDKFMFAGLVAVLLAAPTNPYLESFIFQWMFILPLVSLDRHRFPLLGDRPAPA